MKLDDLSKVDLSLLVVFNALMEELSVTRAADRLDSSQPAMSRNLSRLRKLFGDELFIRQSHGLSPSPRAKQLYLQLGPLLDDILRFVSPILHNPEELERTFSLSMIDPISQSLITPLLDYLAQYAPGVKLIVRNLETYSMDELIAGQLDFVINFGNEAPANIHSRIIAMEQPVCMLSNQHPIAGLKEIDPSTYGQQKHVNLIIPGFSGYELPEWLFSDRDIKLETNNMITALNTICNAEMIMLGGCLLSKRSPRAEELTRIPFASEQPIPDVPIRLLWHRRYHDDAAHRWMREVINEVFLGDHLQDGDTVGVT